MINKLLFITLILFLIFGACPFIGYYALEIIHFIFPKTPTHIYWLNLVVGFVIIKTVIL